MTGELSSLQEQVRRQLERAGFPLEHRAFQPHLTLCRRFEPHTRLDKSALDAALGSTTFPVDTITLMRSDRIDGKLTYTPVATQALGQAKENRI